MGLSEELFDRAVKVIPGGVNSPVRAYGAIGIAPRFIDRADGCHIYDVDGKELKIALISFDNKSNLILRKSTNFFLNKCSPIILAYFIALSLKYLYTSRILFEEIYDCDSLFFIFMTTYI